MYCNNNGLSATLRGIPDGRAGTIETLKIMSQVARNGKTSLPVRNMALSLIKGLDHKDWVGQIKALHRFVRDKIQYVKDIDGVETLQTPDVTLQLAAGDCDDKSILLASLLGAIGHPTRFVAIGKNDDDFVHVYPETRVGNKWLALETTEPVEIGWQPSGYPARLVYHNR